MDWKNVRMEQLTEEIEETQKAIKKAEWERDEQGIKFLTRLLAYQKTEILQLYKTPNLSAKARLEIARL